MSVLRDAESLKFSTKLPSLVYADQDLEGKVGSVRCVIILWWSMRMECVNYVLDLDLLSIRVSVSVGIVLFLSMEIVKDVVEFRKLLLNMEGVSNVPLD